MHRITIGEYMGYLSEALNNDPSLSSCPLYSKEGIPFGFEDHEDTARRFGCSEFDIRVMVNADQIEGIKSNDHIIIPKLAKKPKEVPLPNLLEGFEDDGKRYSGLLSE